MTHRALPFLLAIAAVNARAADPVVKPDPPAAKAVWPATIPPALPKGPPFSTPYLQAADDGPFVVAPEAEGKGVAVIDVRTGRKVGGWTPEERTTAAAALAPDGTVCVQGVGPGKGGGKWKVVGYDTTTGKRLWESEIADFPAELRFVGAGRLAYAVGRGGPIELFDARTGKKIRALAFGGQAVRAVAFSPGGAYLAGAAPGAIILVSTADGSEVRKFLLPAAPDRSLDACSELAFSPDGAKLAAVFRLGRVARVLCWDLTTGERFADAVLDYPDSGLGRRFRWSADGAAWFLPGGAVVDPGTGAVLWTVPGDGFDPIVFPLTADRVVVVGAAGTAGQRPLRDATVPKDRVAAARAAARADGSPVDAWLPAPLAARKPVAAAELPARASDWDCRPDPAAPAAAVTGLVRVPVPWHLVASFHVTATSAVFEQVPRPSPAAGPLTPRELVRIDLATGATTGRIRVPHAVRLADVSADGSAAVTIDRDDGRRVDVWDLATGKHAAGWRPAGPRAPGADVVFAGLATPGRVVTLTRAGVLAGWDVGTADPVYAVHAIGLGTPVRSPGRKYLFLLHGQSVRVIEAATGRLVGDLEADPDPPPRPTGHAAVVHPPPRPLPPDPPPPPLAVRADGAELAALIAFRTDGYIGYRWDLATGKRTDRFIRPRLVFGPAPPVRYAGPGYLLLHEAELFDLTVRDAVWVYGRTGTLRTAASAPDDRVWCLGSPPYVTASATPTAAVLRAVALPHPDAARDLAAARGPDGNLLGRGRTVALKVELPNPPSDRVAAAVREAAEKGLAARGLTVAEAAPVAVAMTVRTVAGAKAEVRKVVGKDPGAGTAETVELASLQVTVTLTVDGKTVPGGTEFRVALVPLPATVRVPDAGTDLKTWLADELWGRLAAALAEDRLPRLVVRGPGGPVRSPGLRT